MDIESLERATLAAVPPQELLERPGWLLALDDGTVGRAHSAVPVVHEPAPPLDLPDVESAYARRGLRPVFRIPRLASFDGVRATLRPAGYAAGKPTLTLAGDVTGLVDLPDAAEVEVAGQPSPEWTAVFLGEGFDPVDAASRLALLRRARQNLFAAARVDGKVVAVGSAGLAHGWCGVHGMRTLPAWRGQGLAGAVIRALAGRAQARGIERAFLQVEENNEPARRLYARAGLREAWGYEYWTRAGA